MADCARCAKGFSGSLGSRSFRSLTRFTPSSLRSRSRGFFGSRSFSRHTATERGEKSGARSSQRFDDNISIGENTCTPSISCIPRRMGEPDLIYVEPTPQVVAFRSWIERELPSVEIPDDATLDGLLSGNGEEIWQHLIDRVVAPKHAIQLRSAMQLELDDNFDNDDDDDVIARWEDGELALLESQAMQIENHIDELRARIVESSQKRDIARLGVSESELRNALINAIVETLDAGTQSCEKYSSFLDDIRKHDDAIANMPDSEQGAFDSLRKLMLDTRAVMNDAKNNHNNELSKSVATTSSDEREKRKEEMKKTAERVAQLNADLENLCNSYSLDDVAKAVRQLAIDATLHEAFDEDKLNSVIKANDPISESTEEFAKRISNQLQDEYLALFASSEPSSSNENTSESPEKRRLEFEDEDEEEEPVIDVVGNVIVGLDDPYASREVKLSTNALDSLDRTLSELTTGCRDRISRALREAKQIDITLLAPLKPELEAAYKTQIRRLEWDVGELERAQHVDLMDLAEPRPCAITWTNLRVNEMEKKLVERIWQFQNDTEFDEMREVMTTLTKRAMKVQERKENVDEKAKKSLLPMLEKAAIAARHTHERTVPAAASEVAVAAKVDAFISARTNEQLRSRSSSRMNAAKVYGPATNVVENNDKSRLGH